MPDGTAAATADDVIPTAGGRPDAGGHPEAEGFVTLDAGAMLHGAYLWVERSLYRLAGSRATTGALPPEVQAHLFAAGNLHAWRAQLWEVELPALAGTDPETLTRPPGAAVAAVMDATAGVVEASGAAGVLAALYRSFVPRLLVTYRHHLAMLAEPAGQPVARVLRLVLGDTAEELAEGEALLERVLVDEDALSEALDAQRAVDGAAVAGGLRAGLFPP